MIRRKSGRSTKSRPSNMPRDSELTYDLFNIVPGSEGRGHTAPHSNVETAYTEAAIVAVAPAAVDHKKLLYAFST
jgi:hypothetical protein